MFLFLRKLFDAFFLSADDFLIDYNLLKPISPNSSSSPDLFVFWKLFDIFGNLFSNIPFVRTAGDFFLLVCLGLRVGLGLSFD